MEGTSLSPEDAGLRPSVNMWLHLCSVPDAIAAAVQEHRTVLAASATSSAHSEGETSAAEHGATVAALAALELAALTDDVLEADSDWAERAQSLLAAVPGGDCLLCASGVPELVSSSGALVDVGGTSIVRDPRVVAGLVQGFRLGASSGPLVAEPLHRVCLDIVGMSVTLPSTATAQPSMSAVVRAATAGIRAGLHFGVALHAPRLVEPLYRAELQCSGGRSGGGEQLGNLYAVLNKRRGVTESEELIPGTTTFHIVSLLPVAESLGFAQDLRAATSGAASAPQMVFSHWSTLVIDPFDAGAGGGDDEGAGVEMSHSATHLRNAARRYMDAARKRKGLRTHDKVVVHAEKQRTLARKK
jgi:ribosome assembly protein 1